MTFIKFFREDGFLKSMGCETIKISIRQLEIETVITPLWVVFKINITTV